MTTTMPDDESRKKAFETAVATRALEIELFWKRSLFFWGFIASAFVGYAALRGAGSQLAVVVASFGLVCSMAWSLVNRGSKYWQEVWETKVERLESGVTGPLFSVDEPEQVHKGCWLRGRRYSVSKLAIALSDYTVLLWSVIILWGVLSRFAPPHVLPWLKNTALVGFVAVSGLFAVLLLFSGRSTRRGNGGSI